MRHRPLRDQDRPAAFGPGGEWETETRANIDEVAAARAADRKPELEFEVYKSRDLKVALYRLFDGKCAYCETRYYAATPMDVEHYRPKGKVEEWRSQPEAMGYYWLGATWGNLLPSCADCNRRREHFDLQTGASGPTLGKRAIFPLADVEKRWTDPAADSEEEPLLLNPFEDRPERLLRFTNAGVVTPRPRLRRANRSRAEASIEIYGLNRPGLVEERLGLVRVLHQKIAMIDRVVAILDSADPDEPVAALAEDLLQFLLQDIRSYQDPSRPHSLAAEQIIAEYLESFG